MTKPVYKYLNGQNSFFEKRILRITPKQWLNDPFEVEPSIKAKAKYVYGKINNKNNITIEGLEKMYLFNRKNLATDEYLKDFLNDYGMISFTERDKKKLLMWSHYANEHKGFAIEFDANHEFFNQQDSNPLLKKLMPVKYDDIRDGDVSDHAEWFFKKSTEWKDEHEYRIVFKLTDSDWVKNGPRFYSPEIDNFKGYCSAAQNFCFVTVPEEAINAVYFGVSADSSFIEEEYRFIKANEKLKHVKTYLAKKSPDHFELTFEEFDLNSLQKLIP